MTICFKRINFYVCVICIYAHIAAHAQKHASILHFVATVEKPICIFRGFTLLYSEFNYAYDDTGVLNLQKIHVGDFSTETTICQKLYGTHFVILCSAT